MLLTFDVQPNDAQNEDDDNHSKNTDRGFSYGAVTCAATADLSCKNLHGFFTLKS